MNLFPLKNKLLGIKHLLFKLKRKFHFGFAFTSEDLEYKQYKIGKYTYGFPEIFPFHLDNKVEIGKFCSIADKVKIFLGGNHNMKSPTTYVMKYLFDGTSEESMTKGDVIIGNDVWIGYGATILSGVKIGDGAVIGAEAVVAKDVEPYAIVVGNPGLMVKKRFDDKTIKKFLKIKWWDWPIRKIKENASLLEGDTEEFIKKFGN
jgi:acetyltransferase-like isoleucine patch superfamily enzyme